jgi:hypothetical protein
MKTYWGAEIQLQSFLTLVLDGGGQLHEPTALPPGREPQYPLTTRLNGHQSWSGGGGEGKENPYPCRISNPGCPAHSLANIVTKLSRLLRHVYYYPPAN